MNVDDLVQLIERIGGRWAGFALWIILVLGILILAGQAYTQLRPLGTDVMNASSGSAESLEQITRAFQWIIIVMLAMFMVGILMWMREGKRRHREFMAVSDNATEQLRLNAQHSMEMVVQMRDQMQHIPALLEEMATIAPQFDPGGKQAAVMLYQINELNRVIAEQSARLEKLGVPPRRSLD